MQLKTTHPNPNDVSRWALLYTLPDAAKGDVRRDILNTILAELYDFFYKCVVSQAGRHAYWPHLHLSAASEAHGGCCDQCSPDSAHERSPA